MMKLSRATACAAALCAIEVSPLHAAPFLVCVLDPARVTALIDIGNGSFRFDDQPWDYAKVTVSDFGVGLEYARAGSIFLVVYVFETGEGAWLFDTPESEEASGVARCNPQQ